MKTKTRNTRPNLLISVLFFLIYLLLIQVTTASAQVRAGVGYLKMTPGTRENGMAGSLAAALDFTHAFYVNPGATGFLREWQWSAMYTNWISDFYNASFVYGKRISMPWSRNTRFVLGVNYLGIPDFNNASEATTTTSGNHLVVTSGMGQRLSFLSRNISIGANLKYFKNTLDQYDAHTFIVDYGLLYRTARIPMWGIADHAILSAGISVTNIGRPIQFISEATPLPETFRTGVALNLGSHRGFQYNLAADYRQVRDEAGFMTFGSEVSWNQLLALRFGYSNENNILGHLTFGASMRFDDLLIKNVIPGRNNAIQVDLASNQQNDFFASPYHGSVTHQPIGPETFFLLEPHWGASIDDNSPRLKWEETRDPDLFDDVEYRVLLDQDSLSLAHVLEIASKDRDQFFNYLERQPFQINHQTDQNKLQLTDLQGGDYFWTVIAYDKDQHLRVAEMQQQAIAKFRITQAEPKIIAFNFEHSPWITEDDYQGKLKVAISNLGDRATSQLQLSVFDSPPLEIAANTLEIAFNDMRRDLLKTATIKKMEPGDSAIIEFEWHTTEAGYHPFTAELANSEIAPSSPEYIQQYQAGFYTIPKGTFYTSDSVNVIEIIEIQYDLPYVGKIFFDSSSAEIKKEYLDEWFSLPPLVVFAERLRNHPEISVYLQGTINPNSGENDIQLAMTRATTVQQALLKLGARPEQLKILPGKIATAKRLSKNPLYRRWILQERRYVNVYTVDETAEKILFGPLQRIYNDSLKNDVQFHSNIAGIVPLHNGMIRMTTTERGDSVQLQHDLHGARFKTDIAWQLCENQAEWQRWLEQPAQYTLFLTDSLNRQFRTPEKSVYLKSQIVSSEQKYFVIAKFDSAKSYYNFYWENLLYKLQAVLNDRSKRIHFTGHGCAIGPDEVNMKLSRRRANEFQHEFLKEVAAKYPDFYKQIKERIDFPEGVGESEPFSVELTKGEEIVPGDNEQPLGRLLNRRVLIDFYEKK